MDESFELFSAMSNLLLMFVIINYFAIMDSLSASVKTGAVVSSNYCNFSGWLLK